ncbi:MAG: nucleotidyltransferase family protein [Gemmiger sp.]
MDFVGVVTEYDPFHSGHAAQLAMLRERGAKRVAVCMSSGLTQRGGIPILPEPVRTRAALESGADLVVALPAPYACAGAEAFARAGVALLTALGCDTLAFGAETPDAAALLDTAALLRDAAFAPALRQQLAGGGTFASARAAAAESLRPGAGALLRTPNNILGVEYCKAILELNSPIRPLALPRLQADHNSAVPGRNIASASWLRAAVGRGGMDAAAGYVPPRALELYRAAAERGELANPKAFSVAVLARLRGQTAAQLGHTRGLSEGLENRLYAAVQQAGTLEELYALLKTKRYPHARLRRLAVDAALGYDGTLAPLPPFLHVLGARRDALPLLGQASLPASTSLAKLQAQSAESAAVAAAYTKAADISALCRVKPMPAGLAFTIRPVVL